jgi:CheY-like chemotaxis protein
VTVANDGHQAVAAWERQPFDLVLMDVQMPGMDGLAATAAIRAREQGSGRHTPIVALTAHAMEGDRERCLAAGMDGYASKPLRRNELARILAGVQPATASSQPTDSPVPRQAAAFSRDVALGRVEGDGEVLQRLAKLFFDQAPKLLAVMRQAVTDGDAKALERAAHKLKSSLDIFGARTANQLAQKLEILGRAGDLRDAATTCEQLDAEYERVEREMKEFLTEVLV